MGVTPRSSSSSSSATVSAPHRDGEARRRGQALRRSHPHRHEEVNFISRTWYYKSIIDLFREFSSTSPEEKESAERRRSNYIPTILFLLMSIRMPDGKKAPGEEREIRTRGMGARMYADVYAEMRLRMFHALFFSLSISFFLSLDTN